ncbi:MAG: hypothetical protein EX268_13525 [Deltaproteobacteria bacterium]|nr:MAG: hypothetical protein EX268_13525 [Deltaproteobacteria bacterium]
MLLLGFLSVAAFSCQESVARFVFEARIVDGGNGNPAAETDATTLRIGIQEGELPAQEYEFPITDGDFDALLEFAAFTRPTRIRVEIAGATTELSSASPIFVPTASAGLLRLVTAAPSSCERVTFDFLEAPRALFGMVRSGTFALIAGGTGQSDAQIEFFDLLEWESRLFSDDLSVSDLGETRAVSVDEAEILVVSANAAPFVFNMLDPTRRIVPVVLHSGAGPSSALVSVRGVGAMVIGGESGGEARSEVSLVAPGAVVTSLQLSRPRAGPAATALGTDVLVVGGDAEGDAELLFDGAATGQPVEGVMDGVREDGLLVSDGESRAILVGGTDAAGAVRQDSLRFDGCPSACVAGVGPAWTAARLDVLQPADSALLVGGESSSMVEEVVWNDANVEIQPVLEMQVPRAGAGGLVLESGAFIVAGGDDGVSIRDDFEFCVPSALEPL